MRMLTIVRWLPGKCGQINMYIHPYKCHVTGSTSIIPLSTPAKPPVWCENDPSRCVRGAKQMIYWAQASGNNVFVEDQQKDGKAKSPGYNVKMGFQDGAQNDIFLPRPEFLHLQAKKRYERPSHARLA
ncbi:hypothetical protein FRC16_001771 [Serendipita sp. 398]|nr:hypothetical protein FRC16_001771 [Serendipita sp. 398]